MLTTERWLALSAFPLLAFLFSSVVETEQPLAGWRRQGNGPQTAAVDAVPAQGANELASTACTDPGVVPRNRVLACPATTVSFSGKRADLRRYPPDCSLRIKGEGIVSICGANARLREIVVEETSTIKGDVDLTGAIVEGEVRLGPVERTKRTTSFPSACRGPTEILYDKPKTIVIQGHLLLGRAKMDSLKLRDVHVQGRVQAPHLKIGAAHLAGSRFDGCVNLHGLDGRTVQADLTQFAGGLRLLAASVTAAADFSAARFVGPVDFVGAFVKVLQFGEARFEAAPADAAPSIRTRCPVQDGKQFNMTGLRSDGIALNRASVPPTEELALVRAQIQGLDAREFQGSLNLRHAKIERDLSLTPGGIRGTWLGVHGWRFEGLSVAGVAAGSLCEGNAPAAPTGPGDPGMLERVLGTSPDLMKQYARMADGDRWQADVYHLRSEWGNGTAAERVFFALTGHGRRPMWWYGLLAVAVYVLALSTFWYRPSRWETGTGQNNGPIDTCTVRGWAVVTWLAMGSLCAGALVVASFLKIGQDSIARAAIWGLCVLAFAVGAALMRSPRPSPGDQGQWPHHRYLFALQVMLPSLLDIGVSVKGESGYFWKYDASGGAGRRLILRFHLFHLAGWIVLSLLAYAVGARLRG